MEDIKNQKKKSMNYYINYINNIKIKKSTLFLMLIIEIILPVIIFFCTHNQIQISILKNVLSSEDTLSRIWTMETTVFTIAVAIITIPLSKTDKKLYGIELSKIIMISDRLGVLLPILFFVAIYIFFPTIYKKIKIHNIPIIIPFYFLSSLIALWFIISTIYVLSYPEDYEKSAKKFYIDKIISKKDFMMLIEENLCPYMYELIEKRNFGEYNRNFEFLIELFSIIRENEYKEKSELLNFMEDKLYEVLKLTEIYLSNLSNSNIKILNDNNYIKLSNLFFIPLNRQKEKKILDLAKKLSMNNIQISYTKRIIEFISHILDNYNKNNRGEKRWRLALLKRRKTG